MFHFNKYQTTSERVSEFYSSKSTRKEKRIESVGKREKESLEDDDHENDEKINITISVWIKLLFI